MAPITLTPPHAGTLPFPPSLPNSVWSRAFGRNSVSCGWGVCGRACHRLRPTDTPPWETEFPSSLHYQTEFGNEELKLTSMEKKYTIFVSSTHDDLKTERGEITKAILELGHIPVGMEMFSAADEEQWGLIQRQILQCDYYIVIIAHRYGSTVGDVSYTEREYDFAVESGIPALGFVIADGEKWSPEWIDKDELTVRRLTAFKQKVKNRVVSFWNSADQLNMKVVTALSKQFALKPRPGWVRSDAMPGPEVLNELSRLSNENAELRSRVTQVSEPQFNIMFAGFQRQNTSTFATMIVLVTYNGPTIYFPAHRLRLELSYLESSKNFDTYMGDTSPLIVKLGDDLQLEGSGYFSIHGHCQPPLTIGCDTATLNLTVHLPSGKQIGLSASLHAPSWRYGEPGLDVRHLGY